MVTTFYVVITNKEYIGFFLSLVTAQSVVRWFPLWYQSARPGRALESCAGVVRWLRRMYVIGNSQMGLGK